MRSSRILARLWQATYNPSHPPPPRRLSTAAPAGASTTTWGQLSGIPQRRRQPSAPSTPATTTTPATAATPVIPAIPQPEEEDATLQTEHAPPTEQHRRTRGGNSGSASSTSTSSWDRDVARAMLDSMGPDYVLARFEALAARQRLATGSAGTLGEALREMRALGLRPTALFYESALEALTIHPDYLLRSTVVDLMRKDWIEGTPEHRYHTALGLLRDGQYEMALDEVDDMLRDKVDVPPFLHDIFIFTFARLGFLDEAMTALERRTRLAPPVSQDMLYFLLDACSAAYHHASTRHLWEHVGLQGSSSSSNDGAGGSGLTPSDGILINVMNTAARHADPPLALEALRHLSDRRVQLSFHHFEPVIEAYAAAGDLEGAFRILCVMEPAGLRPGRDATRSLFSVLQRRPELVPSCEGILEALGRAGYKVPIAAVNVLLEALVRSAAADSDVAGAEALLARLPTLTDEPPTLTTFLPFLLSASPPPHICVAAISLFPTLTLPPPHLARLAAHTAPHSLDAALAYLRRIDAAHKQRRLDAWVSYAGAVRAVADALMRARDPRTWEFVAEMARRNGPLAEEVREAGRKAAAGEMGEGDDDGDWR